MQNNTQPVDQPQKLCTGCQQFYGRPEWNQMCSTCHKKTQTVEQVQKVVEEVKQEEEKKKNVDSSRCKSCNKKIGIYGYECKCAFFFCGKHRLPEDHNCEFDHTTDAKNKLIKQNPLIQASKLDKI